MFSDGGFANEKEFVLGTGESQASGPGDFADSKLAGLLRELAYELHDGPVQILTAAVMDLEGAVGPPFSPDRCQEKTRSALAKVRSALKDLRQFIHGLESGEFAWASAEDWKRAVARVAEFAEAAGIRCEVMFHQPLADLPPTVAWRSLRMIQEAISNVVRHSGSSRAQISVTRVGDTLFFCVRDWGKGVASGDVLREGTGLRSMRYRANSLGGWLLIEGAPGKGTRVFWAIPLHPDNLPARSGS